MRDDRHSKQSFFQKRADCPLGATEVIANWWFKTAKWAQLPLVAIALNEKLRTISLPGNSSFARSNSDCFMPFTTFLVKSIILPSKLSYMR